MKNRLIKASLLLSVFLILACNQEQSLQRYFVDSGEKPEFNTLSLSPKSMIKNTEALSDEDKQQLENISKLNMLIFQKNDNESLFTSELENLSSILKQEKYKSLFSAGEPSKSMEMLYVGEDDEIKEIIIFGHDEGMGFIVARVLGDNLNPNNIYKIMKMGDQFDMSEVQKTLEDFSSQPIDL